MSPPSTLGPKKQPGSFPWGMGPSEAPQKHLCILWILMGICLGPLVWPSLCAALTLTGTLLLYWAWCTTPAQAVARLSETGRCPVPEAGHVMSRTANGPDLPKRAASRWQSNPTDLQHSHWDTVGVANIDYSWRNHATVPTRKQCHLPRQHLQKEAFLHWLPYKIVRGKWSADVQVSLQGHKKHEKPRKTIIL